MWIWIRVSCGHPRRWSSPARQYLRRPCACHGFALTYGILHTIIERSNHAFLFLICFRAQAHFSTDEYIYYKTQRMLQLDDELGDISSKINDRESAITDEVQWWQWALGTGIFCAVRLQSPLNLWLSTRIICKESDVRLTLRSGWSFLNITRKSSIPAKLPQLLM